MTDYLPRPGKGRLYSHDRQVRLSDAGTDGVLRLDGVARYLQDVATDDWAGSGLDRTERWVVRRTAMSLCPDGRWPMLGEPVTLVTWCAGTGPAWAERRTDLEVGGSVMVQAVALWVLLDGSGRPLRLGQDFHEVYGEAASRRRVSGRITAAPVPCDTTSRPWPTRRVDLDVVGHVNNAALWAAVTEVAVGRVAKAAVSHHGPVDGGQDLRLITQSGRLWLLTDAEVVVSAEFELQ